jgi:hypothetical protein
MGKPYRLHQLDYWWSAGHLGMDQFRWLLLEAWQDTEFPHRSYRLALRLFRAAGFVTDSLTRWAALPDPLEVWRGTNHLRPKGISWTIDPGQALWFARRFTFEGSGHLLRGRILKRHVHAFCTGRDEGEVVVEPAKVRIIGASNALAAEHDAKYERVLERERQQMVAGLRHSQRRGLLRELQRDLARLLSQKVVPPAEEGW